MTRLARRAVMPICLMFALLFAAYPAVRCFSRAQLLYTEGWNVYTAQLWATGKQLYPAKFGWTMVDYTALSFVVGAWAHRLTGHWLIPMRLLSLLSTFACAGLVALILRAVGVGRRAAWLGSAFTLALFCISANAYVGVDDPQMLAESVFLFSLLLYLKRRDTIPSLARVAAVATIFVIAGCIKHSPLEFPLAVFIDLLLLSLPLAGWFLLIGAVEVAAAIVWHLHAGGPGFVQGLLLERDFSITKSLTTIWNLFGPLLVPFAAAIWQAFQLRNDARRRVLSLLLATGLLVGLIFEGGSGVSINESFGLLFAMALLVGVTMGDSVPRRHWSTEAVTALLFGWLVVPAITEEVWNPIRLMREERTTEVYFARKLAWLRATPGPALCEDLLLCQEAGKPYLYDPFNATRLIKSGRVPVVHSCRRCKHASLQAWSCVSYRPVTSFQGNDFLLL